MHSCEGCGVMIYDVIIIGAGQSGLAMGYFLKSRNLSFLILEKGTSVGEVWRNRYDSLTLFTPYAYSSLPGLDFKGRERVYPTKNEVANYLSLYAMTFSLPIQFNTNVDELKKNTEGFKMITNKGELTAKNVVVATGSFQNPFIPNFSNKLSADILQIHSSEYRNSTQLKEGSVLVVGGGNSGAQIASELSNEREVFLSLSHKIKFLPQDIGKKSIFWWFDKLGIYRVSVHSKFGQFLKKQPDPIFGFELKSLIARKKVKLKPRTNSIDHETIFFEDGSELRIKNVIWSTGFKSNYRWIDIPNLLDEKGLPIHKRGVTTIDGLYFLGLPWQSSRGSALIQGVSTDAEYLLQQIIKKQVITPETTENL